MYQPAMPDTASHASTRRQARTDGGGGEKESSVPELCSLVNVCGQACVYRNTASCVFTTIFINLKTRWKKRPMLRGWVIANHGDKYKLGERKRKSSKKNSNSNSVKKR